MSVTISYSVLHKIPEGRTSHLHSGISEKSCLYICTYTLYIVVFHCLGHFCSWLCML